MQYTPKHPIEAEQYNPPHRIPKAMGVSTRRVFTLAGRLEFPNPGDWIVTLGSGHYFVVRDELFHKLFAPVRQKGCPFDEDKTMGI